MSSHVNNLIFGIAAAFILSAICFVLGMSWSKLVGGWGDTKFRKWWTTFCVLLPFAFFGMMAKRMAEDHFTALRSVWFAEPFQLVVIIGVTVLLSTGLIIAVVQLWRTPQP